MTMTALRVGEKGPFTTTASRSSKRAEPYARSDDEVLGPGAYRTRAMRDDTSHDGERATRQMMTRTSGGGDVYDDGVLSTSRLVSRSYVGDMLTADGSLGPFGKRLVERENVDRCGTRSAVAVARQWTNEFHRQIVVGQPLFCIETDADRVHDFQNGDGGGSDGGGGSLATTIVTGPQLMALLHKASEEIWEMAMQGLARKVQQHVPPHGGGGGWNPPPGLVPIVPQRAIPPGRGGGISVVPGPTATTGPGSQPLPRPPGRGGSGTAGTVISDPQQPTGRGGEGGRGRGQPPPSPGPRINLGPIPQMRQYVIPPGGGRSGGGTTGTGVSRQDLSDRSRPSTSFPGPQSTIPQGGGSSSSSSSTTTDGGDTSTSTSTTTADERGDDPFGSDDETGTLVGGNLWSSGESQGPTNVWRGEGGGRGIGRGRAMGGRVSVVPQGPRVPEVTDVLANVSEEEWYTSLETWRRIVGRQSVAGYANVPYLRSHVRYLGIASDDPAEVSDGETGSMTLVAVGVCRTVSCLPYWGDDTRIGDAVGFVVKRDWQRRFAPYVMRPWRSSERRTPEDDELGFLDISGARATGLYFPVGTVVSTEIRDARQPGERKITSTETDERSMWLLGRYGDGVDTNRAYVTSTWTKRSVLVAVDGEKRREMLRAWGLE